MNKSKVKIGVLGAYRGTSMINYCKNSNNAEIVAICDKSHDALNEQKKICEGLNITFYDNFDDFIEHDMDAVVLANYAHEHAPFAIKAMKKGRHVFSEVSPVQTMKEAVEDHRASNKQAPRSMYGKIVAEADRIINPEVSLRRAIQYGLSNYPELDEEAQYERAVAHLRSKYAYGGYLKLWIPQSSNAYQLEKLRAILTDESKLRSIFERLYKGEIQQRE